jgi:AcrR family transcriptional regulator
MAISAPARRGRPPTYSREQLVERAAAAVLADPAMPLTMNRLAEAVGVAPMSLYRHFADREDLVVSVAHHLFTDSRPPSAPGASWQEQVALWMRHTYAQAIRVPQLVALIAAGRSPAWIAESAHLTSVLSRAGFDDATQLAEAVYWVAVTTMGHAMVRAAAGTELAPELRRHALDQLASDDAPLVRDVLEQLVTLHGGDFERVVRWTIAGLEHDLEPSRATS